MRDLQHFDMVQQRVFGGASAGSQSGTVVLLWRSRRSLSSVAPLALSLMTEGAGAPAEMCIEQHSSAQERRQSLSDRSGAKDGLMICVCVSVIMPRATFLHM